MLISRSKQSVQEAYSGLLTGTGVRVTTGSDLRIRRNCLRQNFLRSRGSSKPGVNSSGATIVPIMAFPFEDSPIPVTSNIKAIGSLYDSLNITDFSVPIPTVDSDL